jgi:hypothetical protein
MESKWKTGASSSRMEWQLPQMERSALLMEFAVLNGTQYTHSEFGSALLAIRTE